MSELLRHQLLRPGLLTFLRWEWALQARTLRFRLAVVAYLAVVPLPAIALYLGGDRLFGATPGPVTYLIWTQMIQVLPSIVLGCAIGGNRAGLRDREEMWPVLSASPLSNAAYGLRRSAAAALLVLPFTLVATLTAAVLATAAGAPPTSITRWLVVWLLLVYLPAAISAAAWRTLVSASGSEMVAAITALVLMKVVGKLSEKAKEVSGYSLGVTSYVFGFSEFRWATFLLGQAEGGKNPWFGGIASEAPFDTWSYIALWWISHGATLGLCLAVALAVPLWLGRTRRDLPPLRLAEDHWLRSLGPKVYSFGQRLVPDAGRRELVWLPLLVVGVAVGPLWLVQRHGSQVYDDAERRFQAEQRGGELAVTDPALVLTRWRSEGTIARGDVDLQWTAEFRLPDDGTSSRNDNLRLAFTFDPHLELRDLRLERLSEPRTPQHDELRLTDSERHWDRWLIHVTPRPEPGAKFRIRGRLRGRPAHLLLHRGRGSGGSFSKLWDEYKRRGRSFRRSDLIDSHFVSAVTNRRVELWAELLGPVPRYTTWELTPKPVIPGEPGWEVPQESSSSSSMVELDLTFLPEVTLEDRLTSHLGGLVDVLRSPPLTVASACGGMSEPASPGEPVRLVDSCEMPAHEVRILGGRWTRLGEMPVQAAAFPPHREKLEAMLPELRQTVAASAEAWPGYAGIDRLAVLERPSSLSQEGPGMLLNPWDWSRPTSTGRMVQFHEQQMIAEGRLDPAAILDGVLGAELASSRRLDPEQRYMLRSLLSSLMKLRMGVARESAVLGQGLPEWSVVQLNRPLLDLHGFHGIALAHKVPAVVLQLEQRLGMDTLVAAVAEFLGRETEEWATAEELFELLEAHSGEDLGPFFEDYFENGSLPELSLVDVRVLPRRGGFRVAGAVANAVGGEVRCPVVLRTEGPELRQIVHVPGEGRAEFTFDVDARPHAAVLDPDGLCLRRFGGGGPTAERVSLQ